MNAHTHRCHQKCYLVQIYQSYCSNSQSTGVWEMVIIPGLKQELLSASLYVHLSVCLLQRKVSKFYIVLRTFLADVIIYTKWNKCIYNASIFLTKPDGGQFAAMSVLLFGHFFVCFKRYVKAQNDMVWCLKDLFLPNRSGRCNQFGSCCFQCAANCQMYTFCISGHQPFVIFSVFHKQSCIVFYRSEVGCVCRAVLLMLLSGTSWTMEEKISKPLQIPAQLLELSTTKMCGFVAWALPVSLPSRCEALRLLAGVCLQPTDCMKVMSLPVSLVTEVYFYLPDTWRVIATTAAQLNVLQLFNASATSAFLNIVASACWIHKYCKTKLKTDMFIALSQMPWKEYWSWHWHFCYVSHDGIINH